MGILASRILANLFGPPEARVFLLGLDGAGKTTILFKLKFGEVGTTLPTIGFNVETIHYKNISFIIWDVGGGNKIRPLYKHYFQRTHALIHVVDSNDSDRVEETAELLHEMLLHDELRDAVVLVLANKQDLPHALNPTQLIEKLRLNSVKQPWHIQASCAISADGLYEGLDWLATKLSTQGRK